MTVSYCQNLFFARHKHTKCKHYLPIFLKSFLPDATHPRKMRPITKRKWEDLEQTKNTVNNHAGDGVRRIKKKVQRTFFPSNRPTKTFMSRRP